MKQQNICLAKKLRYESTEAEKLVWRYLRARRLDGLKFRRQHPIGGYIADFVCLENRIIIEIDGGQHANEKNKDREREAWLKNQGFKVLRSWNNEVLENLEGILEVIRSNV